MNAIVAGKTSGKTFKVNIAYDTSDSQEEVLSYDCPDNCNAVRIISKFSEKENALFEFRKFYYPGWTSYSFFLGTIGFYDYQVEQFLPTSYTCHCYYDSKNKSFTFNSSPTKIRAFISSIEIGTLE